MGAPRRLGSALAVLAMLALTAVGASAITYGVPDGDGHPNVGAVLENDWAICTGTYIGKGAGAYKGRGIVLTAAHCIDHPNTPGTYTVSFDPTDPEGGYPGVAYVYPGYTWKQGDPGDMAVIVLVEAPSGLPAAALPREGRLSELAKAGDLKKALFTAVGYGDCETTCDVERRVAQSRYTTLTKAWLKLSQNNAQGYGGTCYGDSGGPNFYVNPTTKAEEFIAGLTITGDSMCRATNVTYRLDTPEALGFIGQFIALPTP